MQLIAAEWLRRVEAEYHSAAATQHYTLWLIQAGASPDLIRDGLRIVDDELVHAELSYQVYLAAGGDSMPKLDRDSLCLERKCQELEDDLLRVAVSIFCLGETVAVPLFQRMRQGCSEASARAALDRILVDEVRHRDFGWTVLDYLLDSQPGKAHLSNLKSNLPGLLRGLLDSYGAADPASNSVSSEERGWGLIPGTEYLEILERCFHRDYRPRFARVGVDIGEDFSAMGGVRAI